MIGGGSQEFIVTVESNTAIHNLLSSTEEEEEEMVELTVGGQACEFPQQYIVSIELVEFALLQLLTDTSADLHWEITRK